MVFNNFVNGTSADADEVNASFSLLNETANAEQLSEGITHLTGGNFFNVNFDIAGTLNLLSTTTGLTQVAITDNTDLQLFYAVAPDTGGSTSIALQTLMIGMPYTITQGAAVNDAQLIKQYGDGGKQDFTDDTYWTITGNGVISDNNIADGGTVTAAMSNDLSSYSKLTVLARLDGNAGASTSYVRWEDDSGITNIETVVGAVDKTHLIEIFLGSTNPTYLIFVNGFYSSNGIYDTTFKIGFYCGNTGDARSYCYFLGLGNAATSSTETPELTADGGSNWESVANKESHKFTDTGSLFAYRNAFTLLAGDIYLLRYGLRFGGWG